MPAKVKKAEVTEITSESKLTTKLGDSYYSFTASMVKSLSGMTEEEAIEEQKATFAKLNEVIDGQLAEAVDAVYKKD